MHLSYSYDALGNLLGIERVPDLPDGASEAERPRAGTDISEGETPDQG